MEAADSNLESLLTGFGDRTLVRGSIARAWVADVASALKSMRGLCLLHRDVKPANVLLLWDHQGLGLPCTSC